MSKNFINLFLILFLYLISSSSFSEVIKSPQEEILKKSLIQEQVGAIFPKEAIVIVISRAYEYGSGKDRFCSPDITVTNFSKVGVKSLIFAASYFQTINGARRPVGQSHGKYSIEPNDASTRGFYQLETDSCRDITAYGRVTVCTMRDGRDCTDNVRLSDSGRIPAYAYSSVDRYFNQKTNKLRDEVR
jgi:hypothetical protein